MIAVEEQPTARTQMGTHTQALLDPLPTTRTVLTGIGRFHPDHRNTMHLPIIPDPEEKTTPRRVSDPLGQMAVLDEMADLQGFIGKEDRETRQARSPAFWRNPRAAVAP
ncbi:hypothetical protein EI42_03144 [Thermosporothrix hazakensis]|uniref:Uncharacterized protein n=1 Tax=Thermosporothrix hazakensis TaxID=644383 RepID=A0A326U6F4_THEHA|nr:hypothetical protein EI42_03144 [Thermosporothrix hazakensis]